MTVQPFRIDIPQSTLDDLAERLADTRWPTPIDGAGWDYGTSQGYLQELVVYWRSGYDWRAHEAQLNQLPHFRAEVGGLGIHFIHARGRGPSPVPLLLTHGWPDSFYRMARLIPLLTDPARYGGDAGQSFDVIVPSLPGFGFSDRPRGADIGSARTAALWATLMTEVLGYERFAAGGGDIGSEVTLHLAHQRPELLLGLHLTDVSYPLAPPEGAPPSADAQRYFAGLQSWFHQESAYMMLQATKPQTIGFPLSDSPAGLAAWMVEKFRAWGDCGGNIESRFSKDELLTNIMIYWATETIASSARMYYANMRSPERLWPAPRIEVPVAIAHFNDLIPPREWVEHAMNVQRWTEMPRGGHFAAMEEPELLAEDLRAFFHASLAVAR